MPPDPVARELEDRLHRALVAIGVKVTPMAQPGPRRAHSLLLRDVPMVAGGVPCVVAGLTAPYPALLVIGCGALVGGLACLAAPRTRTFGRGMLIGGVPALGVLLLYGTA